MNPSLPILELRPELAAACGSYRRLIVQAPTGSGKSTQIPQYLLDDGLLRDGRVVVLQPRRLATRLLAARVACERNVRLGEEVGYQIRFEDVSNDRTRIKFETEGILLRQLISDPELREVDAIVFDEFHERHLYGDITLARAFRLQQTLRPDLLLVVMSATLDAGPLQDYLGDCATLTSAGRAFPVEIEYRERTLNPRRDDISEAAAEAVAALIQRGVAGDVLVFMPGAYEIHRTLQALRHQSACSGCLMLPLHGELPPAEQDAAVAGYDQRKIIVSTNVAETSLTIEGVRAVVDSGLARMPRFDPHRSINTLWIEKISRASADQRAGRAGRTAPGICFRLWTEREHQGRALHEVPEIRRLDLSEAVLSLKAAGATEINGFPWFEAPEAGIVARAQRLLEDLGAVSESTGEITALGRQMSLFPVHPRYARLLIAAEAYGCVRQAALIAALTQGRSILIRKAGKDTREKQAETLGDTAPSDFFILMRAWQFAAGHRYDVRRCQAMGIHAQSARQVEKVYESFLRLAKRQGLTVLDRAADDEAVCRCLLAAFADQVACRRDRSTRNCQIVHGRSGVLVRESVVDAPLFVAAEIDEIQSGASGTVQLSAATAIQEAWLSELFPEAVRTGHDGFYDAKTQRVIQEERVSYHDLTLHTKAGGAPSQEAAARILAHEIGQGTLKLNKWDAQVEQWILRVNLLAKECPDAGMSPILENERNLLLEQLCLGCYSYKEVRNRDVWPVVRSFLSSAQLAFLNREAPEKLDIGGQRAFRLTYVEKGPPFLAARIQELFGVRALRPIAGGRIQPLIHILAPNQRPVQITQDLPGFWQTHYPRIRQELKRKYPKHAWPENPD